MGVSTRRVSPVAAVAMALPLVALVGLVDHATGPIAMSLMYYVPIVAAGWLSGAAPAIATALASGASLLWVALQQGGLPTGVIHWNSFTRTVTFLALGVFVALLRRDRDELDAMNNRLRLALEHESDLARTDALTALPNGRSFRERLAHELARSKRDGTAIAIGYLDLDNFKQVNDRFGHDEGDDVLRRAAKAISDSVREVDLAARMGGDEFVIAIVDPAVGACEQIGRRILDQLESIALRYPDTGLGVTIGFASFQSPPADVEAVLKRADDTMYEVKAKGKGRFEVVQS